MVFEELRWKLRSGRTLEEICLEQNKRNVECDKNEVFYDADFEDFLSEIGASVEDFGIGYAVISTKSKRFYEIPYEERENRFDKNLEDEIVLFFYGDSIYDVTELYSQKER